MNETEVWVRMGCTIKVQLPFNIKEDSTFDRESFLVGELCRAIREGRFTPDGECYIAGTDTDYDDVSFEINMES